MVETQQSLADIGTSNSYLQNVESSNIQDQNALSGECYRMQTVCISPLTNPMKNVSRFSKQQTQKVMPIVMLETSPTIPTTVQTRCQEYQARKDELSNQTLKWNLQGTKPNFFWHTPTFKVNVCGPSDLKYPVSAMESFIPVMVQKYSFGLMRMLSKFDDPLILLDKEIINTPSYLTINGNKKGKRDELF
ncbi:unnamed protein product [Fraxinus pennsylvanica]|uniref:Uncharacterized protein n=1 Tax=Fraxinus pennsylvanica TaxID=56036 RepID=A0AAD1ZHA4_9LAMI|nr:unnamed protein product [Fraxinus pennsylvanica]